jgi:hypothetical protein
MEEALRIGEELYLRENARNRTFSFKWRAKDCRNGATCVYARGPVTREGKGLYYIEYAVQGETSRYKDEFVEVVSIEQRRVCGLGPDKIVAVQPK